MKKILTLSLGNRSDHAKTVLEALRKCEGIGEYAILVSIEPGNEEMLSLAKSIDFSKVHITFDEILQRPARSTYRLLDRGFKKASFVIHMDDNTVPAVDLLRYMEHCCNAYYDDQNVFSVTAYNHSTCKPFQYNHVSRRNPFTSRVFGTWKNRWEWVRQNWCYDSNAYATDLSLLLTAYELVEIYPLVSRCQVLGFDADVNFLAPKQLSRNQPTDYRSGHYILHSRRFVEVGPLVTAVMVTGLHLSRYSMARVAIDCFKKQSYHNRELLIINHGSVSLFDGDVCIRELRLKKGKYDTVGDLRNLGIEHASGDFIINWDDDDWHHPKRIEIQMSAQKDDAGVFLKNRIHYSFQNRCAMYNISPMGADATILHPKSVAFRYPSLIRNSDSHFAKNFKKRIAIDNDPSLYIRFFHGLNLWDHEHVMRHLAGQNLRNVMEVNPEHERLLKRRILPLYRGKHRAGHQLRRL